MSDPGHEVDIQTLPFAPELDRAYRLYAAKTIEDRALPDVRDGCKPVQRRILYAMYDMGLRSDRPHKKCARIVGEVLGKYHPHGDQSVYGSLARLAQPFSMREPLVDGQGNFGSIDGDSPAAMRYTEARLSPLGELMLQDLEADTVAFGDNFDGSLGEPMVLPAVLPNLLVNGASGIAVGMATNIPPHNLGEVADAVGYLVERWRDREAVTTEELMTLVPGPDFPTGGVIYRYRDVGGEVVDTIATAYGRGRGLIVVQARMHLEPIVGGKTNIIVTELPYNVQKNTVIERIAREVKEGHITGVTDLRDESDYDAGMRVVVEVSRKAEPEAVMADLLKYSQLQETFGCNNLALVPAGPGGGLRPRNLTLRELLEHFVAFRLEVIERRTKHELEARRQRRHVVQGLLVAVDQIDAVVALIRRSRNPDSARENLKKTFRLSEVQAQAILDMPLRRLTSLETSRLKDEEKELAKRIRFLAGLLASEGKRLEVVAGETMALKEQFATPRRSVILDSQDTAAGLKAVTEADLRTPEGRQVVVITTGGVERRPTDGFRYAPAPGLTSRATTSHIMHLRAGPTDEVLLVSTKGRGWRNTVGFVPEKALFEQLGLQRGEGVVGMALAAAEGCLVLGTRAGRLKRTRLSDIALAPGHWAPVIGLPDSEDEVVLAAVAPDDADVIFATAGGLVLRTAAGAVNPQAGAAARGVVGIRVKGDDRILTGAVVAADAQGDTAVYVVSARGFVKRVPLAEYPRKGRGGRGVQTMRATASTGPLAAVAVGPAGADLDVVFADGKRFRLAAADVPDDNRYNLGKRLVPVGEVDAPIVAAVAL
ncbi:MAG: DNA topoisomerase (ATP-hydrolyzing) subunit A [Anaerolineae bacterium]